MPARKVPLRATSRLDHQARAPLATPVAPEAGDVGDKRAMPKVTWLGDMLTPDTNSFGVIRLLLALAVLVSHSVYLTTGQAHLEPLYRWTNYTLGQHGVQMFFFLSGILVAQSLFASRSVRDYATARALRIFPGLFVCVLLTALVLGPLVTMLPPLDYLKHQGTAAYIAKTASLWSGSAQLPGVFTTNTVPGAVNTSVWTLKYEVLCYVLLGLGGLVVFLTQRWREAAIVLFGLWAAAVLYKPVGLELHGGAETTLQVLQYFMIFFGLGTLAYALRRWLPVHALLLVPLGGLFVLSLGGRFQEPATAVFLGYLMLWLSTFRFGALRAFTNGNDYSYATYLYHMPVSQLLLHLWPQMETVPLIMATAGIVLWLAFLSWELVERPALALRHKIWSSVPSPTTNPIAAVVARIARRDGAAASSPATAAPASATAPATNHIDLAKAAAIAAARASERVIAELRRHTKAAAAGTDVTPPLAAAGKSMTRTPAAQTEPGAAQVWRPMPTPRKLRIQDEAGDADAIARPAAPPAAVAEAPLTGRTTFAQHPGADSPKTVLRRMRSQTPATSAEDPVVTPTPPAVPASRIAFATKKPAAAPPNAKEAIDAMSATKSEASRAVVVVSGEDTDTPRQPRQRMAQPRPTWSRPLGHGRPRSV